MGLLVSPKSRVALPRVARLGIELALFAAVAVALGAAGRPPVAVVFAVVAVVSGVFEYRRRSLPRG